MLLWRRKESDKKRGESLSLSDASGPLASTLRVFEINTFETPEAALWNGEYVIKVSGYLSALPDTLSVSGKYERMWMAGADAAMPIGETVLRLEAAFFPMRHFQKSAESIIVTQFSVTWKPLTVRMPMNTKSL